MNASGIEGRLSYAANTSWSYTGSWSPATHGTSLGATAGIRWSHGPLTLDANMRQMQGRNRSGGTPGQVGAERNASGVGPFVGGGIPDLVIATNTDNSQGMSMTYTPTSWWSHSGTIGLDQLAQYQGHDRQRFTLPIDTIYVRSDGVTKAATISYSTTAQIPMGAVARVMMTIGATGSHDTYLGARENYYKDKSGNNNAISSSRSYGWRDTWEHGGFVQSQVGLWDAFFVTYGVRAIYNPYIGAHQNPNVEPHYGVAYTCEIGDITAKLRASYGTATRPPAFNQRLGLVDPSIVIEDGYTSDTVVKANPDLMPSSQQGGEGGLELYVGTRGSFQVTRYNQTVDNLIVFPITDSVDLLPSLKVLYGIPDWKYPYRQHQNLNLGSVRNQGWELHGTMNLSVLAFTGTYSWNMSRLIGITPRYRTQFPQYVVGGSFNNIPEHTYALGIVYARRGTRIAYDVQGEGQIHVDGGLDGNFQFTQYRLDVLRPRAVWPPSMSWPARAGFLLGDLNASHQFSPRYDATLQVHNVTNSFKSDVAQAVAQPGRTTGLGVRLHF